MVYKVLRVFAVILIKLCFRFKVVGLENIPDGAAVLVSNHASVFDPVPLGVAVPRPIHFMAKVELFKNPISSWFFRKLHAFPVKRGEFDRAAIRSALAVLGSGQLLGIFPEGTRNKGDEFLPLHSGAALLASRAQAPIIPIVIRRSKRYRLRPGLEVLIGRPIRPEAGKRVSKEELARVNDQILAQFTVLNRQEFSY
ncbi:MAG: 1-acyl-sn-glycerol-3-phosphate acyltransferase [Firmicutes bacterium]|jgi:1-acyl-sn-glycerol-3-phosphate acyltransferase|nr:lysophospholipid acyltransferase family protein [Bacillota bacterium]NLL87476.1 1-acyl-sn-glycerol-3-phosphate acyltransferase [Bacillota bacterium]HKM17647.1 lysophospholipid acyltransferase family protein [Limnochordia bacterium]